MFPHIESRLLNSWMVRDLLHNHTSGKLMGVCVSSKNLYTCAGPGSLCEEVEKSEEETRDLQKQRAQTPKSSLLTQWSKSQTILRCKFSLFLESRDRKRNRALKPILPGNSCAEALLDDGGTDRKHQLPESVILLHPCTVGTPTTPLMQWPLVGENISPVRGLGSRASCPWSMSQLHQ